MRTTATIGFVLATGFGSLVAAADTPKCPDATKVRSGTEFCAPENQLANFPSVAYCTSGDDRYRSVCPTEWIDVMWLGHKQSTLSGYQSEVDEALAEVNGRKTRSQRTDNPDGDAAAPGRFARDSDSRLREILCMRGRQIASDLTMRLQEWRMYSAKKYALASIAEADGVLKAANRLEVFCKLVGNADAGASR